MGLAEVRCPEAERQMTNCLAGKCLRAGFPVVNGLMQRCQTVKFLSDSFSLADGLYWTHSTSKAHPLT